MELVIKANFANGSWTLCSEGEKTDLIGHHYPILHASRLEFRTNVKTYCETDMHYWERKPKDAIAEGKVVEPIDIWCNFYGMYLRCKYRGLTYDIKTSKIIVSRKEVKVKASSLKVGDYVICSPTNMLTEAGRQPHFDGEIVAVHEMSCTVKCMPMGSKKIMFLEILKSDIMTP